MSGAETEKDMIICPVCGRKIRDIPGEAFPQVCRAE